MFIDKEGAYHNGRWGGKGKVMAGGGKYALVTRRTVFKHQHIIADTLLQ